MADYDEPEKLDDILNQDSLPLDDDDVLPEPEFQEKPSRSAQPAKPARDKVHSKEVVASARGRGRNRQGATRFFILKSVNRENLQRSFDLGVWASQPHNDEKLNAAFSEAESVILFFSVNMSGHYQGYARMASMANRRQVGGNQCTSCTTIQHSQDQQGSVYNCKHLWGASRLSSSQ